MWIPYGFAQNFNGRYLPEGAIARFGKGYIFDFAYSPDGTRLAIASTLGVWLYDTETCEELHLLTGHTNYVALVGFSPDSKVLVSADFDDYPGDPDDPEAPPAIKLWDVATGDLKSTLPGSNKRNRNLIFSPDGKSLAGAGEDRTIRLWDSATGEHKTTFTGYRGGELSFSPDGSQLASAGDEVIRLWDVVTSELQLTFAAHANSIDSLIYSPDGKRIATHGGDNNVCLWDANTGEFLHILKDNSPTNVSSIDFLKDNKTLVIASSGESDGTVRLWNANTTEEIETFTWDKPLESVLCSPMGRTYACDDNKGTVLLFDANTGTLLHTLDMPGRKSVNDLRYSPDGQTLAVSSGSEIYFYSVNTGALQNTITGYSDVLGTTIYAPDEKTLASEGSGIVRIWDVHTGQRLKKLSTVGRFGHTEQTESYIRDIAYSPDGATLACGTRDATILLWNATTWEDRLLLKGHTKWISSVAFSPDGQTLASGSWDKTIRLWNPRTGENLKTFNGYTSGVSDVAFSPNGQTLASGDDDGTIRFWNVATGELIKTITTEADSINSVAFSPDGKTLATAGDSSDYNIRFWDVATGELLQTIADKHARHAYVVVYSPDGQVVATDGLEGEACLWNATTGELLKTLTGHKGTIYSITYSSDSKTLVTSSRDSTVILWDLTK